MATTANRSTGATRSTGGRTNLGSGQTGSGGALSSSSGAASASSSSTSSQQPQVSLLGTIPLPNLSALLHHITTNLVKLPPSTLLEKETILSRHDDETSTIRETGDNAWASVVKGRKGVRLRVRESLNQDPTSAGSGSVDCCLFLPLPPLPERQYPKATVRPTFTTQILSDTSLNPSSIANTKQHTSSESSAKKSRSGSEFSSCELGFDPETLLSTDAVNGWKNFVSSIGWRPSITFLRYGYSFALHEVLTRHPNQANPLNPVLRTKHVLNIYRIFRPDPTEFTSDWVPLDPEGATVVVELLSIVGGQLDQAHFNPFVPPMTDTAPHPGDGGLDPSSTIEEAVDFVDSIARSLRGFVDLKREGMD